MSKNNKGMFLPLSNRKFFLYGISLIVTVIAALAALAQTSKLEHDLPGAISSNGIIAALRTLHGENLYLYLESFQFSRSETFKQLGSDQIDQVITELSRIAENDIFEKTVSTKGPSTYQYYANRSAANELINQLKCRKLVNDVRPLPLSERIDRIMDYVEGRRTYEEPYRGGCLLNELIEIGPAAVPALTRSMPAPNGMTSSFVDAISRIHGASKTATPAGLNYLTKVLQDKKREVHERIEAARALGALYHPDAFDALVTELASEGFEIVDPCCSGQSVFCNQPKCPVRIYPMQRSSAEALSNISGTTFPSMFTMDAATWRAWDGSTDRQSFNPLRVERSQEDMQRLALFYVAGLVREFPCQFKHWEGEYWTSVKSEMVRSEIQLLGEVGIDALMAEYRFRHPLLKANQECLGDFRSWVSNLLDQIGTPKARIAQNEMDEIDSTQQE